MRLFFLGERYPLQSGHHDKEISPLALHRDQIHRNQLTDRFFVNLKAFEDQVYMVEPGCILYRLCMWGGCDTRNSKGHLYEFLELEFGRRRKNFIRQVRYEPLISSFVKSSTGHIGAHQKPASGIFSCQLFSFQTPRLVWSHLLKAPSTSAEFEIAISAASSLQSTCLLL